MDPGEWRPTLGTDKVEVGGCGGGTYPAAQSKTFGDPGAHGEQQQPRLGNPT